MKFIINALLCKIVFHNLILMHIFSIHLVFITTQSVQNQNTLWNYIKLCIEMSYRMLITILNLQYQNTKLLMLVQCWIQIYFFFSGRDMCGFRGDIEFREKASSFFYYWKHIFRWRTSFFSGGLYHSRVPPEFNIDIMN